MQTITQRLSGGGGPRRRIAAALGAIVVVVIAIGIVVGAGAPGSSKGQGSSGSTASGATTVQRRDLIETDTESGTLGYANQQTVFNRLSGTITFLPNVGAVIKPGGTLYQVDGYPVILFNGSYPAYRDLTSADTDAPDIKELNADLKSMGFDPDDEITVDDAWQAGTTDAVERWQESIGQTETGTITLGQVIFLPGPQLINTVDTTIGSTGGSAGAGASGSGASDASGASDPSDPTSTATPASYPIAGTPHAEFVDLTTSTVPGGAQSSPSADSTRAACPNDPTTTTTQTTTPPPSTCPPITTTPTTPTTPTTTTPTTTTPQNSTTGTSSGTLEAIVKLLETQNKLLSAELMAAKKSAGSGKGSTGSAGSSGGGGGAKGVGASSSGSGSSGASSSGTGASSSGAGSSGSGASASAILATSSTELVVTVDLDATKQNEAKLHEPVTVQLPDGSTVNGRITAVSPVAQSSSSSSSASGGGAGGGSSTPSATIPVTVSLQKHVDASALDQAAVSVNFEQAVANHVLSVPVTALLATQGGGYAVQEAAAPHKLIPVTPGLFAAGYVQISGPELQDGMQVTDSQG